MTPGSKTAPLYLATLQASKQLAAPLQMVGFMLIPSKNQLALVLTHEQDFGDDLVHPGLRQG